MHQNGLTSLLTCSSLSDSKPTTKKNKRKKSKHEQNDKDVDKDSEDNEENKDEDSEVDDSGRLIVRALREFKRNRKLQHRRSDFRRLVLESKDIFQVRRSKFPYN